MNDPTIRKRPGIYIFCDQQGTMIYIGQSLDPIKRFGQHVKQPWFHQVAGVFIEPLQGTVLRKETALIKKRLLDRESKMIIWYNPKYNKMTKFQRNWSTQLREGKPTNAHITERITKEDYYKWTDCDLAHLRLSFWII